MTDHKNIKIVIGANFGDEGKGLMTGYFCREAALKGEKSLVICHNGGSQRGHTVVKKEGIRHVFHHFGSGSFSGADTYLSQDFIVNPMVFRQEWDKLQKIGCTPNIFAHPQCRVTTPFDMILNQLLEEKRSCKRHGSCGMGIFETICRYKKMEKDNRSFCLNALSQNAKPFLLQIRDEYFPRRLEKLNLTLDNLWKTIIASDSLIEHYLEDLDFMYRIIKFAEVFLFSNYQTLVFEGGQGLLLDQNNQEYYPHLTPSSTGLKNPVTLLNQWAEHPLQSPNPTPCSPSLEKTQNIPGSISPPKIEICYVTRPYLTRHGAGRLDLECAKEEINPAMTDLTNVPNPYQGSLRYAKMDLAALKKRILQDFNTLPDTPLYQNCQCSLAITHRNECRDWFFTEKALNPQELTQVFAKIYHSWQEDSSHICCEQQKEKTN